MLSGVALVPCYTRKKNLWMGSNCLVCFQKVKSEDDANMKCGHVAHARCLTRTQNAGLSKLKCTECNQFVFKAHHWSHQHINYYAVYKLVVFLKTVLMDMFWLRVTIFLSTVWIYVVALMQWFVEPFITSY